MVSHSYLKIRGKRANASPVGGVKMKLMIKSSAFADKGEIPVRHTCDGEDCSPPLEWSGVPEETRSLALIMDDPDAPDPKAPQRIWVHWVLYNIPPAIRALPEAFSAKGDTAQVVEGLNDWNKRGYGGPCPPIGRHRYFFKLYALNIELSARGPETKKTLEHAIKGHILAEAQMIGTYKR